MKILILIIFAMMFLVYPISAYQDNKWVGIYTFDEENKDFAGKRSSRWFRLEVKEENDNLVGNYSDGENGNTYQTLTLSVKTGNDTASFYFDKDLTIIELPCSEESIFRKGDLMFELKNSFDEKNKPILQTIWGKENLGARSETGGIREGNIFFRKVK